MLYSDTSSEGYERKSRAWSYCFSFLPRKCRETGKLIWLEYAYRGRVTRRYDMDLIFHDEWMCKQEFIILRLKGLA